MPDVIPYCLSQQRIATTPQLKAPPLTPRDVGDEDDEEEHLHEQHVVFYVSVGWYDDVANDDTRRLITPPHDHT